MLVTIAWVALNLAAALFLVSLRAVLARPSTPPEAPRDPAAARQDMIYIWTEIHGIPRQRAEAMYEEYERAAAVSSLGLKGK